jgi:hypothetical protein
MMQMSSTDNPKPLTRSQQAKALAAINSPLNVLNNPQNDQNGTSMDSNGDLSLNNDDINSSSMRTPPSTHHQNNHNNQNVENFDQSNQNDNNISTDSYESPRQPAGPNSRNRSPPKIDQNDKKKPIGQNLSNPNPSTSQVSIRTNSNHSTTNQRSLTPKRITPQQLAQQQQAEIFQTSAHNIMEHHIPILPNITTPLSTISTATSHIQHLQRNDQTYTYYYDVTKDYYESYWEPQEPLDPIPIIANQSERRMIREARKYLKNTGNHAFSFQAQLLANQELERQELEPLELKPKKHNFETILPQSQSLPNQNDGGKKSNVKIPTSKTTPQTQNTRQKFSNNSPQSHPRETYLQQCQRQIPLYYFQPDYSLATQPWLSIFDHYPSPQDISYALGRNTPSGRSNGPHDNTIAPGAVSMSGNDAQNVGSSVAGLNHNSHGTELGKSFSSASSGSVRDGNEQNIKNEKNEKHNHMVSLIGNKTSPSSDEGSILLLQMQEEYTRYSNYVDKVLQLQISSKKPLFFRCLRDIEVIKDQLSTFLTHLGSISRDISSTRKLALKGSFSTIALATKLKNLLSVESNVDTILKLNILVAECYIQFSKSNWENLFGLMHNLLKKTIFDKEISRLFCAQFIPKFCVNLHLNIVQHHLLSLALWTMSDDMGCDDGDHGIEGKNKAGENVGNFGNFGNFDSKQQLTTTLSETLNSFFSIPSINSLTGLPQKYTNSQYDIDYRVDSQFDSILLNNDEFNQNDKISFCSFSPSTHSELKHLKNKKNRQKLLKRLSLLGASSLFSLPIVSVKTTTTTTAATHFNDTNFGQNNHNNFNHNNFNQNNTQQHFQTPQNQNYQHYSPHTTNTQPSNTPHQPSQFGTTLGIGQKTSKSTTIASIDTNIVFSTHLLSFSYELPFDQLDSKNEDETYQKNGNFFNNPIVFGPKNYDLNLNFNNFNKNLNPNSSQYSSPKNQSNLHNSLPLYPVHYFADIISPPFMYESESLSPSLLLTPQQNNQQNNQNDSETTIKLNNNNVPDVVTTTTDDFLSDSTSSKSNTRLTSPLSYYENGDIDEDNLDNKNINKNQKIPIAKLLFNFTDFLTNYQLDQTRYQNDINRYNQDYPEWKRQETLAYQQWSFRQQQNAQNLQQKNIQNSQFFSPNNSVQHFSQHSLQNQPNNSNPISPISFSDKILSRLSGTSNLLQSTPPTPQFTPRDQTPSSSSLPITSPNYQTHPQQFIFHTPPPEPPIQPKSQFLNFWSILFTSVLTEFITHLFSIIPPADYPLNEHPYDINTIADQCGQYGSFYNDGNSSTGYSDDGGGMSDFERKSNNHNGKNNSKKNKDTFDDENYNSIASIQETITSPRIERVRKRIKRQENERRAQMRVLSIGGNHYDVTQLFYSFLHFLLPNFAQNFSFSAFYSEENCKNIMNIIITGQVNAAGGDDKEKNQGGVGGVGGVATSLDGIYYDDILNDEKSQKKNKNNKICFEFLKFVFKAQKIMINIINNYLILISDFNELNYEFEQSGVGFVTENSKANISQDDPTPQENLSSFLSPNSSPILNSENLKQHLIQNLPNFGKNEKDKNNFKNQIDFNNLSTSELMEMDNNDDNNNNLFMAGIDGNGKQYDITNDETPNNSPQIIPQKFQNSDENNSSHKNHLQVSQLPHIVTFCTHYYFPHMSPFNLTTPQSPTNGLTGQNHVFFSNLHNIQNPSQKTEHMQQKIQNSRTSTTTHSNSSPSQDSIIIKKLSTYLSPVKIELLDYDGDYEEHSDQFFDQQLEINPQKTYSSLASISQPYSVDKSLLKKSKTDFSSLNNSNSDDILPLLDPNVLKKLLFFPLLSQKAPIPPAKPTQNSTQNSTQIPLLSLSTGGISGNGIGSDITLQNAKQFPLGPFFVQFFAKLTHLCTKNLPLKHLYRFILYNERISTLYCRCSNVRLTFLQTQVEKMKKKKDNYLENAKNNQNYENNNQNVANNPQNSPNNPPQIGTNIPPALQSPSDGIGNAKSNLITEQYAPILPASTCNCYCNQLQQNTATFFDSSLSLILLQLISLLDNEHWMQPPPILFPEQQIGKFEQYQQDGFSIQLSKKHSKFHKNTLKLVQNGHFGGNIDPKRYLKGVREDMGGKVSPNGGQIVSPVSNQGSNQGYTPLDPHFTPLYFSLLRFVQFFMDDKYGLAESDELFGVEHLTYLIGVDLENEKNHKNNDEKNPFFSTLKQFENVLKSHQDKPKSPSSNRVTEALSNAISSIGSALRFNSKSNQTEQDNIGINKNNHFLLNFDKIQNIFLPPTQPYFFHKNLHNLSTQNNDCKCEYFYAPQSLIYLFLTFSIFISIARISPITRVSLHTHFTLLLNSFNSRLTQLILGAGLLHIDPTPPNPHSSLLSTTPTLPILQHKAITAKHLTMACSMLNCVIIQLKNYRKIFSVFKISSSWITKVETDFLFHLNNIYTKLSSIIGAICKQSMTAILNTPWATGNVVIPHQLQILGGNQQNGQQSNQQNSIHQQNNPQYNPQNNPTNQPISIDQSGTALHSYSYSDLQPLLSLTPFSSQSIPFQTRDKNQIDPSMFNLVKQTRTLLTTLTKLLCKNDCHNILKESCSLFTGLIYKYLFRLDFGNRVIQYKTILHVRYLVAEMCDIISTISTPGELYHNSLHGKGIGAVVVLEGGENNDQNDKSEKNSQSVGDAPAPLTPTNIQPAQPAQPIVLNELWAFVEKSIENVKIDDQNRAIAAEKKKQLEKEEEIRRKIAEGAQRLLAEQQKRKEDEEKEERRKVEREKVEKAEAEKLEVERLEKLRTDEIERQKQKEAIEKKRIQDEVIRLGNELENDNDKQVNFSTNNDQNNLDNLKDETINVPPPQNPSIDSTEQESDANLIKTPQNDQNVDTKTEEKNEEQIEEIPNDENDEDDEDYEYEEVEVEELVEVEIDEDDEDYEYEEVEVEELVEVEVVDEDDEDDETTP